MYGPFLIVCLKVGLVDDENTINEREQAQYEMLE